jgi:hypothetical protein
LVLTFGFAVSSQKPSFLRGNSGDAKILIFAMGKQALNAGRKRRWGTDRNEPPRGPVAGNRAKTSLVNLCVQPYTSMITACRFVLRCDQCPFSGLGIVEVLKNVLAGGDGAVNSSSIFLDL